MPYFQYFVTNMKWVNKTFFFLDNVLNTFSSNHNYIMNINRRTKKGSASRWALGPNFFLNCRSVPKDPIDPIGVNSMITQIWKLFPSGLMSIMRSQYTVISTSQTLRTSWCWLSWVEKHQNPVKNLSWKINWKGYCFIISDQGLKFSLLKRITSHWDFFFFGKSSDYDYLVHDQVFLFSLFNTNT